jgi:hypothetical protein
MTSDTGVASILGFEKQGEKDKPGGYPSLDASGYVPANEIGYMSLIPIAVYVESNIPFIDDGPTYSNLVFCASGHRIAFDDALECFNMRKI